MKSHRFMLSVMMFLNIAIWGTWLPQMEQYLTGLGFTPGQQGWILNTFALASFVGMFFSNQFADRNFAAERFLAVSMLISGLAFLALAWVQDFWVFFALMLVHCLLYVPTISITNSIAFANLKDPQREFGLVRLWGTIGWIAASWPFIFLLAGKEGQDLLRGQSYMFILGGACALVLTLVSLFLPHTPPKPAEPGGEQLAWLEAMKLLRVGFVAVLFVVTFFDATIHQCYFIWTNGYLKSIGISPNWIMAVMCIGQIAEIGTMAILGAVLAKLGWQKTMVIGILGHAARFAVFAFFPYALPAILVNILHGICYAFFFATVYIFVDEFFPKDARSSAQGLFNFVILGAGPFVGNFVGPFLKDYFSTTVEGVPDKVVNYQSMFLIPSLAAVVAALFLFLFFRPPERAEQKTEKAVLAH